MLGLTAVAIAERSMEPALHPGDWWIVRRRGRIRPGVVVLFEEPGRLGLHVVKRVIRHESDGWWVEGDNADLSIDSRAYGAIPETAIVGVLWFKYRRAR